MVSFLENLALLLEKMEKVFVKNVICYEVIDYRHTWLRRKQLGEGSEK